MGDISFSLKNISRFFCFAKLCKLQIIFFICAILVYLKIDWSCTKKNEEDFLNESIPCFTAEKTAY